ncbi:hypothetical protein DPQ22_08480 [Candidatus Tokpelaia sp.]|nr:hypothetical protein DPQ22_08480 [Candidatus Tokpelaia sp.]
MTARLILCWRIKKIRAKAWEICKDSVSFLPILPGKRLFLPKKFVQNLRKGRVWRLKAFFGFSLFLFLLNIRQDFTIWQRVVAAKLPERDLRKEVFI